MLDDNNNFSSKKKKEKGGNRKNWAPKFEKMARESMILQHVPLYNSSTKCFSLCIILQEGNFICKWRPFKNLIEDIRWKYSDWTLKSWATIVWLFCPKDLHHLIILHHKFIDIKQINKVIQLFLLFEMSP